MFQPVRIQVWLVAADAGARPATPTAMNNAPAASTRALATSKAQPRAATAAKAAGNLWKRSGQHRRVPVAGCGRVGSMTPPSCIACVPDDNQRYVSQHAPA